ncbi:MAG TPA: archease, partial [Candidatus Binatia bacterium]|nr:archease [Candidatus Binatia bacterium]
FEVTAHDLAALFSAAGEALYALIVDPETVNIREEIAITASGQGPDELLHAWLCELLAQFNINGFVAKRCEVAQITNEQVSGTIRGEKLDLSRHAFHTEIKGVTYHRFKVWKDGGQWHARVILDV